MEEFENIDQLITNLEAEDQVLKKRLEELVQENQRLTEELRLERLAKERLDLKLKKHEVHKQVERYSRTQMNSTQEQLRNTSFYDIGLAHTATLSKK